MIAKNLQKTLSISFPDTIFFASGVSNSSSTSQQDFERELSILSKYIDSEAHLVYFSTCSIYDPSLANSSYVKHKLNIESILGCRPRTTVIRLPQVIGNPPNPFTLCNLLYSKLINQQSFYVWKNATRYLIDIDDVIGIMSEILPGLGHKTVFINIAPPQAYSVLSLVQVLEEITGIKAVYTIIEKGRSYSIDLDTMYSVHPASLSRFGSDYLKSVIYKYFSRDT